MNAAQQMVKALQAEKVNYVFGVPGEENEDLLFALAEAEGIEFVPCRHEQGAAFIANMWGRLSGRAGVCLSTLGPGATNLMTGVADAQLDKAPLVAITGQGSSERIHHESHQMLDIVQLFAPITKWNAQIESPKVIPEIIRKAFKLAEIEKPGATHVELPENIAAMEIGEDIPLSLENHTLHRAAPNPTVIAQAVRLIKSASKPIILVGNGAVRKPLELVLRDLVQSLNFPIVSTFMGKGAISDQEPQSLFAVGLGFKDFVIEAFEEADLVITVGYDIAEYAPKHWNPDKKHTIIHMDYSTAEVYEHYLPEIEIIGDLKLSLTALLSALKKEKKVVASTSWYAEIRQRIADDIDDYPIQLDGKFTVPGTLKVLREIMDEDGLVISDVGAHKMWIARNFRTYQPNSCIISNGLASMGIALPGGIAASLLYPKRQIVSMMGDGGFLMNVQELETAHRLGIGYTIIVFNDNDYGLISWKQEQSRSSSVYTSIGNPNFIDLARSFGLQSFRPTDESSLRENLLEAVQSPKLTLLEIPINTAVNHQLTQKLDQYFESKEN